MAHSRRIPIIAFADDADYKRGVHQATVPFDHVFDDLVAPSYWAPIYSRVKAGGIIEAFRADYTLDVRLRITKVEQGLVFVNHIGGRVDQKTEDAIAELRAKAKTPEQDAAIKVPDELNGLYKFGYIPNGDNVGFFVKYMEAGKDGLVISRGLLSKQKAIDAAMAHHIKAAA